eukprot:57815-Pyramimonas_sp.AAC.1
MKAEEGIMASQAKQALDSNGKTQTPNLDEALERGETMKTEDRYDVQEKSFRTIQRAQWTLKHGRWVMADPSVRHHDAVQQETVFHDRAMLHQGAVAHQDAVQH